MRETISEGLNPLCLSLKIKHVLFKRGVANSEKNINYKDKVEDIPNPGVVQSIHNPKTWAFFS